MSPQVLERLADGAALAAADRHPGAGLVGGVQAHPGARIRRRAPRRGPRRDRAAAARTPRPGAVAGAGRHRDRLAVRRAPAGRARVRRPAERARRALRVGRHAHRRGRARRSSPRSCATRNQRRTWFCGERRAGLPHRRRLDRMGRRLAVRGRGGRAPRRPARGARLRRGGRARRTDRVERRARLDRTTARRGTRIREFDAHVEEVALALIDGPAARLPGDRRRAVPPAAAEGEPWATASSSSRKIRRWASTPSRPSVDPSGALCVAAAAQELKGVCCDHISTSPKAPTTRLGPSSPTSSAKAPTATRHTRLRPSATATSGCSRRPSPRCAPRPATCSATSPSGCIPSSASHRQEDFDPPPPCPRSDAALLRLIARPLSPPIHRPLRI